MGKKGITHKALHERAKPRTGLDYTARQHAILNDEIPVEEIRTTELSALMKRANERADQMAYDIAEGFYDLKIHPCEYMPHYTMAEAKAVLQSLTPWEIHWDIDVSDEA